MTYTLEVADDGTLTIPANLIPNAAPHTRYVVAVQSETLTLNPQPDPEVERQAAFLAWKREVERLSEEIGKVWPEGLSAVDAIAEQRR